uniref:Uncharacterized protein n=1 Tax=Anopheles melas TaxID=34690 RepID=A0A182TQ11_9DIPT
MPVLSTPDQPPKSSGVFILFSSGSTMPMPSNACAQDEYGFTHHRDEQQQQIDARVQIEEVVRNHFTQISRHEHKRRSPIGPDSNARWHTSAKLSEGTCSRRQSSCEQFTSMCMQWVQTAPMNSVPNRPTYRPACLNASGIARMPVPMLPFSRWIIVSRLVVGCSSVRCIDGSYGSPEEEPYVGSSLATKLSVSFDGSTIMFSGELRRSGRARSRWCSAASKPDPLLPPSAACPRRDLPVPVAIGKRVK